MECCKKARVHHIWECDKCDMCCFCWTFRKEKEKIRKPKEYWYYLVWTWNNAHCISDVRKNIDRFLLRKKTLGLLYVDISLEETDMNSGKKIRAHYNMRVKTSKSMVKSRFKYYEREGNIYYDVIRVHSKKNWENVGNYISKENPPTTLLAAPTFS